MKVKPILTKLLYFGLCLSVHFSFAQTPAVNVLVFSKTAAFRHESIAAGKTALTKLSKEKNFGTSFTEDATQFSEKKS